MEHTKHIWRACLIIVLLVVGYLVGRPAFIHIFLPSFGEYGPYRGDALREEMAMPSMHGAGIASCAPCHDERVSELTKAAHKSINCETCHAPLVTHVKFESLEAFLADPDSFERTDEMAIQHAKDLCIRCHESQPAKPRGFPQVVIVDHLEQNEVVNSPDVCLDCHNPHAPSM